jgi:3-polyprenyl-4-hydroxybenzoate decarboxylase
MVFQGEPVWLFEKPKGSDIRLLGNLFGTSRRMALGMGQESMEAPASFWPSSRSRTRPRACGTGSTSCRYSAENVPAAGL